MLPRDDHFLVTDTAWKILSRCDKYWLNGRFVDAASELNRMIGLGIGLTPSGDDFLCGILAGFILSGHQDHLFFRSLRKQIAENLDRTNELSGAFLQCAPVFSFQSDGKASLLLPHCRRDRFRLLADRTFLRHGYTQRNILRPVSASERTGTTMIFYSSCCKKFRAIKKGRLRSFCVHPHCVPCSVSYKIKKSQGCPSLELSKSYVDYFSSKFILKQCQKRIKQIPFFYPFYSPVDSCTCLSGYSVCRLFQQCDQSLPALTGSDKPDSRFYLGSIEPWQTVLH